MYVCVCSPGTTIAAALGGVVLFLILLALLVFYLRRQQKLRKKATLRRILQEHEVRGIMGHVVHQLLDLHRNLFDPAF